MPINYNANSITTTSSVISGGTVTTGGATNLTLNTNSGTTSGSIVVTQGANANITLSPNGSGGINIGGFASANKYGMIAYSNGQFAAVGDAQKAMYTLRCKTTTNSAVEMALDGGTTYLTITSGKVLSGILHIVGTKSDGSAVAIYTRQFAIKNVGGTTTLVGTVNTIGTDTAAGTTISITANDTTDYLSVRPTGVLNETWRWVAYVDAVEIAYGT